MPGRPCGRSGSACRIFARVSSRAYASASVPIRPPIRTSAHVASIPRRGRRPWGRDPFSWRSTSTSTRRTWASPRKSRNASARRAVACRRCRPPASTAGEGPSLDGWLEDLAGGAPVPGGGSAAALAGALAGALVAMVARLTVGRKAYAAVERRAAEVLTAADTLRAELRRLVDDDAAAYAKVSAAYRIPKDDATRARAIDAALVGAAQPPLEVARRAARLDRKSVG